MWPFSKRSLTCFWSSFVSTGFVMYVGRFGSVAPGTKSIWCSIPLMGGKPTGFSPGKTSMYSCKRNSISAGMNGSLLVEEISNSFYTINIRFCCSSIAVLISLVVAKTFSLLTLLTSSSNKVLANALASSLFLLRCN